MRAQAKVYVNDILAGTLTNDDSGFSFIYDEAYRLDPDKPAISLSFPKDKIEYISKTLFPFFFGLLAEGENKELQCRILKIDEHDHFARLLKTAQSETIGAVTVREYS